MAESPTCVSRPRPTGRPVCKYGPKKKPMKHKNHVCGYQERHAIIQFVAAHGMIATLDRYYNKLTDAMRETQRKKICQWIAKTEHIECMAMSPSTAKKRCWRSPGTGTTLSAAAEEMLVR
ncbi:hypothetical protein AaE_013646 [Aphanomyces astaci]|uniref:Uncharacterized protein n=1 Tax=Aphanomyces astaci TaxID=112090 RepID=A0A6A4ZAY1_APHAT|nr:hypothetical protein AaE_013646 [Aphanomyces astaci]